MTLTADKEFTDGRAGLGSIGSGRFGTGLEVPDPPRDPVPQLALTVAQSATRGPMSAALGTMLVDGTLELSIEGASTLTVTVADPERNLIRSGALESAARVEVQGRRFMLVAVERQQNANTLDLTFEAEAVALLRRYSKPKVMYRDRVTRAQFLEALVREVKERRLGFSAPHDYRIITNPAARAAAANAPSTTDAAAQAASSKGADTFRRAKVKGTLADGEQRRILALAMRICDEYRAPFWVRVALVAGMTQEAVCRNPREQTDLDSIGVLQALYRYVGSKGYSAEWQIREILTRGFTGWHGYEGMLKSWQRRRKGGNALEILLWHLNPYAPRSQYSQWMDEARRTVHLWIDGGTGSGDSGSTGDGSGTAHTTVQRYAFKRGSAGQKEDSWTAMRRLADEVNWALWVDGDTVHYAPEDWLLAQGSKWTLRDGGEGVQGLGYTIDHGRVRNELTASVRADRWQVRLGDVAIVQGEGPADGRWIVTNVRRGIFDAAADLTLARASKPLHEPAPQVTTTPGNGGGGSGTAAGTLREKIVAIAQSQVGTGSGSARSKYGYGPTNWCAAFSSWCWRKAGCDVPLWLMAAGAWDAGGSRRHYRPIIGDTIHYGRLHVGIVVRVEGDNVWTVDGNYSDAVTRRGPFHFRGYPPGGPASILGYTSPPGA